MTSQDAFLAYRLENNISPRVIAAEVGINTNDVFRFGYGNKIPNAKQKLRILQLYGIDIHAWGPTDEL